TASYDLSGLPSASTTWLWKGKIEDNNDPRGKFEVRDIPITITSSTGTIAGTVSRASDGGPISGVLVEALQSGQVQASTNTPGDGSYSIADLPVGTYDVRASATGYVTQTVTGVSVTENATTTLNFSLDAAPPPGPITYIYDALGRLTGVVDPARDTVMYTYDEVGNLLSISRQSSSVVSIIEFTPNSGPVGTTVTIYGTGFSATPSENTVTFNGVKATVTSATPTQIVTSVPSGATTGPIAVTAPAGSATSTAAFTVTASGGPPTITGFSPTIGTPGTAVTITGTNYETIPANNKVKFNVALASVSAATTTTISASVPFGTGSGRISVTTPSGTAVSTDDFFIPPSPYTETDVEVTGRMAIGGPSQTVTIATANKIALIVFNGTGGKGVTLSITSVTISGSTVRIYNPNGTLLTSTSVTTSGGGINTVLPSSGTYTILVDPNGTDTGSMTLLLASPDLTPTTFTAPSAATTQQAISLSWTVTNQGTGAAQPSWLDRVYLSTDQVYGGDTSVTIVGTSTALAAGGSYTQTLTVTTPKVPAGDYYLLLRVDHYGNVYEADETNNQRVVPITITTPDLAPTAFTAPNSATTQEAISLSWTVTNQGTASAQPSWTDRVYLSADQVFGGDTFVTSVTTGTALAVGANYTRTVTVTTPKVPAGDYYLLLRVDHYNFVYEADETNNQAVVPITIIP
ncbi:MAG: CARDB domain-containing protein, partial [Gemmatimonadales bacterium]